MTKEELFEIFAAGYCAGYSDTPLEKAFEEWLRQQQIFPLSRYNNKEQQ